MGMQRRLGRVPREMRICISDGVSGDNVLVVCFLCSAHDCVPDAMFDGWMKRRPGRCSCCMEMTVLYQEEYKQHYRLLSLRYCFTEV